MATATAKKSDLREQLGVVSPAQLTEFINILVYGEPGTGKTYLAGTAEDYEATSPVLYLDIEGGTLTLKDRKDIDVKPVRSLEDLEEVHKKLMLDNTGYYKTVVIDTFNELQDLDMKNVLAKRDHNRPDHRGEPPSQREWGISRDHMRKICRAFRDLPMNTIYIAHSATDKDEAVTTYAPMFPGKLQKEIPGFMDIVAFMTCDVKQVGNEVVEERRLQLVKTKRVMAKDRTGKLGRSIENPSVPLLWELIHS